MILNLFDNTLDKFQIQKIKFQGISSEMSISEVLSHSKNIKADDLQKYDQLHGINFHITEFGTLSRISGDSLYSINENQTTVIFEFGEKQPGRYILNQLAVIEAEE